MHAESVGRFHRALPADLLPDAFVSLRLVEERSEQMSLRKGVLEPPQVQIDVGAMVTVHEGGGLGYAATADLTQSGLREAIDRARSWAQATRAVSLFDPRVIAMPNPKGEYRTPVQRALDDVPVAERISFLHELAACVDNDSRFVDWETSVYGLVARTRYVTNQGGDVMQEMHHLAPDITLVASADGVVQKRSTGQRGMAQQGGWEVIDRVGIRSLGPRLREEALALLTAPDCPSGDMHLLIDPGQMMLQIHESIGHPLELDRILGDERNYAGRSFVTPEMFGRYRYGSELLDVTFDPTLPEEFASYGWDDEGASAQRVYLIRKGVLEAGLGSVLSQHRSGIPGVANARSSSWNRPPIDRMGNINVEPGTSSLQELVSQVERGVYMETNTSWSIDDSRNKFQFGCELGRIIEDGELKGLVRTPNYRGISATFWRNLVGVGDRSTYQVLGTPYCGKGEPNQIIRVGHASPACLFADVSVFGGA